MNGMAFLAGVGHEGPIARFAGTWALLVKKTLSHDDNCVNMLMGVSLGLGLLSTLAASFSFYWFVKMKRTFRHDLIMLLIQADLIKSVWFVIFPIYSYLHGPVDSNSPFCQVSGFFLALGLESSDVAVLLIALHSAMYIWRPQSGLYPYRWLAYGVYVFIPVLFASLAFLDGGYENVGESCYLPSHSGWARLALSWVPRHILIAFIVITYTCIYIYVRRRIVLYERRDSMAPHSRRQDSGKLSMASHYGSYRDRLLSTRSGFRSSVDRYTNIRRRSTIFSHTSRKWSEDISETRPVQWNMPTFAGEHPTALHITVPEQDPHLSAAAHISPPPPTASPRQLTRVAGSIASSTSAGSRKDSISVEPSISATATISRDPVATVHRPDSCTTMPAAFHSRRKSVSISQPPSPRTTFVTASTFPGDDTPEATTADGEPLTPHISHDPLTSPVSRNRDKVRRQLRSLFVYPLLYLAIWVFPIVNQWYGYGRASTRQSPPWLVVCGLASLAVQGFADSALFTAREKPWRHSGGKKRRGKLRRLVGQRDWTGLRRMWASGKTGRTREEMLVDERIARARREAERKDEISAGGRGEGESEGRRRRRHWWEGTGFEDV